VIVAYSTTVGLAVFVVFLALFVILAVFVIRFAKQLGRRAAEGDRARSPERTEDRDEG